MKTDRTRLYEKYHSNSKVQYKIINDNNFTYINILSVLNKLLNSKIKKVLDVGCGTGTISFYLASKGYNVLGIDISKKAIDSCIESAKSIGLKNINFKLENFPHLDFSRKFDFVFLSEVIEHLPNDRLALNKIHNMLNHNGILFLSTPSNKAPLHRWGLTKEFDKRVGHEKRYSVEELTEKLKSANFKIKKIFKKESFLRNFLYVNPHAGKLIRFIRGPFVPIYHYFDDFLVTVFGESQIIIVAQKK